MTDRSFADSTSAGDQEAPARRIRLDLAYDGAAFYGAQVQPQLRTVGSVLATALQQVTSTATPVTFAGRTDRGVHALGQVAHSDLVTALTDQRLQQALNALLPADVVITRLHTVPASFHARYSACWREYRYQIWQGPVRHPALAQQSWHRRDALDLAALNAAAGYLVGRHDFATFAGQGLGVAGPRAQRSTVRTVLQAHWVERDPALPVALGRLYEFWIRGDGFLPQMVRTIVSTAVEVGMGRQSAAWVGQVVQQRDRRAAPAPAPPHGLTFWQVGYTEAAEPAAVEGLLAGSQGKTKQQD